MNAFGVGLLRAAHGKFVPNRNWRRTCQEMRQATKPTSKPIMPIAKFKIARRKERPVCEP